MKELIERLRTNARHYLRNDEAEAADALEQQAKQIEELAALCDRMKQEAQINAQEARTANATIAEIYQCVTGSTGEPGNWNGAKPVRDKIEELAAALAVKDEALESCGVSETDGQDYYNRHLVSKAIALQPHASLVAKIKAEAARDVAQIMSMSTDMGVIKRILAHADRIEREGE